MNLQNANMSCVPLLGTRYSEYSHQVEATRRNPILQDLPCSSPAALGRRHAFFTARSTPTSKSYRAWGRYERKYRVIAVCDIVVCRGILCVYTSMVIGDIYSVLCVINHISDEWYAVTQQGRTRTLLSSNLFVIID